MQDVLTKITDTLSAVRVMQRSGLIPFPRVDEGVRVRGRAEVGGAGEEDAVALVAAHAVVHPRKRVAAGGRYPQ